MGKELQLAATPMAGVVFGDVDGVAPALLLDAKWKWLELWDESEYVVATSDHADSFFYTWNELTVAPREWLRFGLVAQRTQAYDTRLSLDRGLLLSLSGGPVTGTVYWFNPDRSDSYVTFSVAFVLNAPRSLFLTEIATARPGDLHRRPASAPS